MPMLGVGEIEVPMSLRAWEALERAYDLASEFGDQDVLAEHLLLAILETDQLVASVLNHLGVDPEQISGAIELILRSEEAVPRFANPRLGPGLAQVFELGMVRVCEFNDPEILPVHLLLGMLDQVWNLAAEVFREFGVDAEGITEKMQSVPSFQG